LLDGFRWLGVSDFLLRREDVAAPDGVEGYACDYGGEA